MMARVSRRRSANPAASTRPRVAAASRTAKVSSSRNAGQIARGRAGADLGAHLGDIGDRHPRTDLVAEDSGDRGLVRLLVSMRNAPTASDPVCRATSLALAMMKVSQGAVGDSLTMPSQWNGMVRSFLVVTKPQPEVVLVVLPTQSPSM